MRDSETRKTRRGEALLAAALTSVTVSSDLCEKGAEAVSAELTSALKSAHAKSGAYAQQRMGGLYEELGLSAGMAGMGDKPPGQ